MLNANNTKRTITPVAPEEENSAKHMLLLKKDIKSLVWDNLKAIERFIRIIFLLNLKIINHNQLIAFYLGNNSGSSAKIITKYRYNKCNSNVKNWKSESLTTYKVMSDIVLLIVIY